MAGDGDNDFDQAMADHVRSLHARWHCRSTPRPPVTPPPVIPIASSSRPLFKKINLQYSNFQPFNNFPRADQVSIYHPSNNQTSLIFQQSSPGNVQPLPHCNRRSNTRNFPDTGSSHSNERSLEQSPPRVDDVPWIVEPSPPRETADWGSWKGAQDGGPLRVLTDKEKAMAVAKQVQWTALQACVGFFKNAFSDAEESDDEIDEEDGYQSKVFDFLLDVFEKDVELRGYYEKNWESGYFSCLVCGASRVKVGKLYSNCIGLVQHAKDISKTMKPRAHRALANAVCRVLRWDIKQLPSIVLDAAEPFSTTFGESSQHKEDAACDEGRNISRDVDDALAVDSGADEVDANASDNDEVDWDQIDSGEDEVDANVNTNTNANAGASDDEVDWDQIDSGDDDDSGNFGRGGEGGGVGDESDDDEIDWDNL